MSEQPTPEPLFIDCELWYAMNFEIDEDGDLAIDIGEDKCDLCGRERTYLRRSEAKKLRDWLNKAIPNE